MAGESGDRVHFKHIRLGRAFVDHPVNAGEYATAQSAMGLDAEALHALKERLRKIQLEEVLCVVGDVLGVVVVELAGRTNLADGQRRIPEYAAG